MSIGITKPGVLAALLLAVLPQAARAQTPITIGEVGSGSVNRWPAAIATEKGFFRAHGVEPKYLSTPSSSAVMQQLAGGSLDMGTGGLVDPIRAIDKGAPIFLFRTEAVVTPYELFARKSIGSIADLRGKTISIGGIKDITRIYLERLLSTAGLKLADVDLVFAGATAPRYAALVSGSIDATLLAPPFNFKASDDGLKRLARVPDIVHDFPYTGYAVSKAWAKGHRDAVLGFLAAYQEGVDWFTDTSHRSEAVDIALKFVKVDRSDLEQTYDFYQQLKVFDRKGRIGDSGVDVLLRVLSDLGDLEGPPDLARFYDPTLVTGAKP